MDTHITLEMIGVFIEAIGDIHGLLHHQLQTVVFEEFFQLLIMKQIVQHVMMICCYILMDIYN